MLQDVAAVLGMQRVWGEVCDAGRVERSREILCRERLLWAGENIMSFFISERRWKWVIWSALIGGFILGNAVGGFIAIAIDAAYLREAVR